MDRGPCCGVTECQGTRLRGRSPAQERVLQGAHLCEIQPATRVSAGRTLLGEGLGRQETPRENVLGS